MATTFDKAFPYFDKGVHITGLFKKGKNKPNNLPLIVLIHGGVINAAYFDNPSFSSVILERKKKENMTLILLSGTPRF